MKIVVSGLTACGKTTHCHLLAKDLNYRYIHGSSLLNNLVEAPTRRADFWLTDESFDLDRTRINNPEIDFQLDDLLKKTMESSDDNIVFDVWTLPWLSNIDSLNIWLESSLESRIVKSMISITGKSSFSFEDVAKRLPIRDQNTRNFYLQYYHFDIFSDRSPFDFVIDITGFVSDFDVDATENINKVHEILLALVDWHQNQRSIQPKLQQFIDQYSFDVFLKVPKLLDVFLK